MADQDYDEVLRKFYRGLDADGFVRLMFDGGRPWAEKDMPEIRGLIDEETLRAFWTRGMESALASTTRERKEYRDEPEDYLLKILACFFASGAVLGYIHRGETCQPQLASAS